MSFADNTLEISAARQMVFSTQLITDLIWSYERYMVAQTNFNIYKRRHYTMTPVTRRILRNLWYRIHYNVDTDFQVQDVELERQIRTDADLIYRLRVLSDYVSQLRDAATHIDRNQTTHYMQQGIIELPPNIFRSTFYEAYDFGSTECRLTYQQVVNQDIPVHLLPTHQVSRRNTQIRVQQYQQQYLSTPTPTPTPTPTLTPTPTPAPQNQEYRNSIPNFSPPAQLRPRPSAATQIPPHPFALPPPMNLYQQYFADIIPPRPPIKVKYEQKLYTKVTHDDCAICYTQYKKYTKVTTNCNHSFCVTCINKYTTNYTTLNNSHNPISCPMCRTEITEMRTHTKKNVYAIACNPNTNIDMEPEIA